MKKIHIKTPRLKQPKPEDQFHQGDFEKHIEIFLQINETECVNGTPTYIIYDLYVLACERIGLDPLKKIAFSKLIVKSNDFTIVDIRYYGKKFRVFREC